MYSYHEFRDNVSTCQKVANPLVFISTILDMLQVDYEEANADPIFIFTHRLTGVYREHFLLARAAWDWRYIDQLTPELALFLIRYYSKACLKLLVDYLPITPLYSQVWRKYVRRMTLIGFEDVLKQSGHAQEAVGYFGL